MNRNHEVDGNDMKPDTPDSPAPNDMEQAQKDAAEEREEEGGYNG